MVPVASSVYKRFASLISDKRCQQYSITMGWLRTVSCFALLRSAIMCLHGNRVSRTPLPASNFSTDLVVYESLTHLPSQVIEQISFTLILTILFFAWSLLVLVHMYISKLGCFVCLCIKKIFFNYCLLE